MAEPGEGGLRDQNADVDALPPELKEQSISRTALILPHAAALQAIAHLTSRGRRLENWEGWIRLRDGSRTRSLAHGGSFALSRDAARAAETAAAAITRAHETSKRSPEYPGAELYFALTFTTT